MIIELLDYKALLQPALNLPISNKSEISKILLIWTQKEHAF
tara:strand:+ start:35350 stop:35472 length:123 start_codon:yes stop_codon:yes gene_type:complete